MPECFSAQFDLGVFYLNNESPNIIEHSIYKSKCKHLNGLSNMYFLDLLKIDIQ